MSLQAILLSAVAVAGPPVTQTVGGTAKPVNAPAEVPAVPGPGDQITAWQQAATLPWVEAVQVTGQIQPDGGAFRGPAPPVLVVENRLVEFTVTCALSGGETIVFLSEETPEGFPPGLPEGPAASDYARMTLGNPDRLAFARP